MLLDDNRTHNSAENRLYSQYLLKLTFLLFRQNDYGLYINEATCTPVKPSCKAINGEREKKKKPWVKYRSPSCKVNEMRDLSKSICSGFCLATLITISILMCTSRVLQRQKKEFQE